MKFPIQLKHKILSYILTYTIVHNYISHTLDGFAPDGMGAFGVCINKIIFNYIVRDCNTYVLAINVHKFIKKITMNKIQYTETTQYTKITQRITTYTYYEG